MTQISPEHDEEVVEEEPVKKHAKWVGVLLSLLTTGAGQFLAGYWKRGIGWFIGLSALSLVGLMVMASPLIKGVLPGLVVLFIGFGFWICMLCDAYQPVPKIGFWRWLLVVVGCVAINNSVLWIYQSMVYPFHVPTHTMEPTIRGDSPADSIVKYKGDKFFAEKFVYWFSKPQRGDIVIFKSDGIEGQHGPFLNKRIVGLPGDKVSIRMGKLFINGFPVTEPPVFAKFTYTNPAAPPARYLMTPDEEYVVPAGHYFVLGDNSVRSQDSRYYGPVPEKNILGKVTKIYWPPERIGVPE